MHISAWRTTRLGWFFCGLCLASGGVAPAGGNGAVEEPAGSEKRDDAPLILDDPVTPLVAKQPRTEADRDRIEALALFGAARTREQRGDYAGALRYYQRALRYDPQSAAVARAIVPLAFRLNRHDEAIRYALKAVELEQADPLLLRSLAKHLVEMGDVEHAVALYEKAVEARSGEETRSAADVVMQLEMSQFHHLVGQDQKAAEDAARVLYALEHPEQFQLDTNAQDLIRGEKGTSYVLFGEAFLKAGRFDEALSAFDKAHELGCEDGPYGYHRARVLAKTGRPTEALESLGGYLKARLSDEGTDPYELLAEILAADGRGDELTGRLEELRAEDEKNVPLGYFLAEKYREAGQLDKAAALYGEMIQKKPILSGYRSLIDILRRTDQPERLLEVLAQVAATTASLDALGAEGDTLAGDAKLVDRVIDVARAKLKKDPKSLSYAERLGAALLAARCKRAEVAGEFFNLAIDDRPESASELLLLWGVGLLVDNQPAEAAKVFQRGVDGQKEPKGNPTFSYYLAGALEMDGRTDEALGAARAAAAAKPDSARFASREAWILYHAKRHEEARKAYEALVAKFDNDYKSTETREALREARLALSNICVTEGRLADGEEWLHQVLDEFPDDIGALNDLGYLWADQGKHLQRSLRMIEKAVEGDADNIAYRDSLGWALYRLERYREAIVELEAATSGEKPDAVILDHLGDAYEGAGRHERARRTWRRAMKSFTTEGNDEEARKVQEKLHQATHEKQAE